MIAITKKNMKDVEFDKYVKKVINILRKRAELTVFEIQNAVDYCGRVYLKMAFESNAEPEKAAELIDQKCFRSIREAKRLGQRLPKVGIGDVVKCPPTLYNEVYGEVIQLERLYQELDRNGNFDMDGLCTMEGTIDSIAVPYDFDGETLTVHYPEADLGDYIHKARSRKAKFWGWGVTVNTPKMCSLFNEKDLKKVID